LIKKNHFEKFNIYSSYYTIQYNTIQYNTIQYNIFLRYTATIHYSLPLLGSCCRTQPIYFIYIFFATYII
jgi:hypothetical protein